MIHQYAAFFIHITPFVMGHQNVSMLTYRQAQKLKINNSLLFFCFVFLTPPVFRGSNQFHF